MSYSRQLLELIRPFPSKYVHENPSGGGSYIKHHVIEQRLIQVFGIPPSFRVREIVRGDIPAVAPNPNGKSRRAKEGSPALSGVVVGVVAEMAVSFVNEAVTVEEAGDCEQPHNWDSDGQRLKDAMSDAYKRCAMRLGCGLHLWSQDEYFLHDELAKERAETSEATAGPPRPTPGTRNQEAGKPPSAFPPGSGVGGGDKEPAGPTSSPSLPDWLQELRWNHTDEAILAAASAVKKGIVKSLDEVAQATKSRAAITAQLERNAEQESLPA